MNRPAAQDHRPCSAVRAVFAAVAIALVLAACGGSGENAERSDSADDDGGGEDACRHFRTVIQGEVDPEVTFDELLDGLESDFREMQYLATGPAAVHIFMAAQEAAGAAMVTSVQADWANTVSVVEAAGEATGLGSSDGANLDAAIEGMEAAGDNLGQAIDDVDAACNEAGF